MTDPSPPRRKPVSFIRRFLDSSASGGLVLMAAAAAALLVANSPLAEAYDRVLHAEVAGLTVLHGINDGLMALFFLLVGLEIKREVLDGQLSTWPRRVLPGAAALGGMVAPAILYLALNAGEGGRPRGWAIPAATDIAFALGVLALLGRHVPMSLRVFLAALAILDDLGAIVVMALFYSDGLSLPALAGAAAVLAALVLLNRLGVMRLALYLLLGAVLWWLVLRSGVHATLAGVALALTIPMRTSPARPDDATSPLHVLEHALGPWVAFGVVPAFGFANAGLPLAGLSLDVVLAPVTLGIALGLFVGKQAGVLAAVALATRLGWADLPAHASWRQMYGVSLLCGIGFTMSLFIGLLAFPGDALRQDEVRLGVLAGSLASALAGAAVLRLSSSARRPG